MSEEESDFIDLRSDTVTKPNPKMRELMAGAAVGDDVYREDPTVLKLERKAAGLLGKEAGLFFPSGTMANQTALLTHTVPGQEVILGEESHIFYYEVGGAARLGGLQTSTVDDRDGCPRPEEVEKKIRGDNIHYPQTGLICLENTHNRAGGKAVALERIEAVAAVAEKHDVPLHLDGARIFNAATALNISPAELAEPVDSITFCLSKGLGAPVGSMLVGSEEFIEEALKNRKLLGGGMRQVGILAAAGIEALTNIDRLEEDHRLAEKLARGISELDWKELEVVGQHTNFVILKYEGGGGAARLKKRLEAENLLVNAYGDRRLRLVTHLDVDEEDIEKFINGLGQLRKELE